MAIKELKSLTFGDGDTYVIPAPEPTKWEDIQNNPFGGGSNTVSWSSAGIDFNSLPTNTWVKVSDAVVTMEDFENATDEDFFITWLCYDSDYPIIMSEENSGGNHKMHIHQNDDGSVGVYIIDSWGNTYDGVQYRQDGVFFFTGWEGDIRAYPLSATVPGFGKIESSTTLDSKYLPEGLQTETITLSDTITLASIYDQDTGMPDVSIATSKKWLGSVWMVSDANIPIKSCPQHTSGAYEFGYYESEDWGINVLYAFEIQDGFYRVEVTDPNGNTFNGGYCATKGSAYDTGLYMDFWESEVKLTVYGGAVFEIRTPKPIDKKYLPDDIGMPEVTAEDNGKFLRVVDGVWSAVAVPNAEGVGF